MEMVYEINLEKNHSEACINFQVLRDGSIGVLIESGIVYYSVDTLQQLHKFSIIGHHESKEVIQYMETDDVLVLLNITDQLLVINKESEIVKRFEDVFFFTMIENLVYYVTNENTIFKCTSIGGSYTSTIVVRIPDNVLLLGHANDILYIMTVEHNIYSFVNNTLKMVLCNGSNREKLEALKNYNFANRTDWETVYSFYVNFFNNQDEVIPEQDNIHIIRIHGSILLVGYENFILRIFYSVYKTSIIDLLKSKPVKVCNLLEQTGDKLKGAILNIQVLEETHSHSVLVATPMKIIVIKFTHALSNKNSFPNQEEPTGFEEPTSSKKPPICDKKMYTSSKEVPHSQEDILTSHKNPEMILKTPQNTSKRMTKKIEQILT